MKSRFYPLLLISLLMVITSAVAGKGCIIKPKQTVEIRSPVVGRLVSINVERGEYVKKGSVLAKLDSSVEQATVNSAYYRAKAQAQIVAAQNKVKAAKMKVKRMKALYEAKFMSAQALDDTNSELKVAQADFNFAKENQIQAKYEYQTAVSQLGRRIIKSPLNGVVTKRFLDPGAIVSPTDGKSPILTLAQTDVLKIQIIAPVKYYKQFKKGSTITIVPEAPFDEPIVTTVATKDSDIDATSGTFSLLAYIKNVNNDIPSGILCQVKELNATLP